MKGRDTERGCDPGYRIMDISSRLVGEMKTVCKDIKNYNLGQVEIIATKNLDNTTIRVNGKRESAAQILVTGNPQAMNEFVLRYRYLADKYRLQREQENNNNF